MLCIVMPGRKQNLKNYQQPSASPCPTRGEACQAQGSEQQAGSQGHGTPLQGCRTHQNEEGIAVETVHLLSSSSL